MKILLIAPNSDFTKQLVTAFNVEGHNIVHLDDRLDYALPSVIQGIRPLWRLGRRIPWWRARSNHALQVRIRALAHKGGYDLLLATKGMNVSRETLQTIKEMSIPTAVWFPDNAANEPYASWIHTRGPLWDYFFSFDSAAVHEQMPVSFHNRIHILPFGVDPSAYAVEQITNWDRERYQCEVCFIGAPYPDRVRLLQTIADFDLRIWGWSGWKNTPLRDYYRGPLDSKESAKSYQLANICVNTNVRPHVRGVNLKTFEIPAAGGFQLTDHVADLDASFIVGEELDTFSDENDFRNKVRYWLEHPEERIAVATAGRARVLRDHTLRQRVRAMVAIVS